jgi:acyl-ACP thioesterase
MVKILNFSEEFSTNHYYVVRFVDPDTNQEVNYCVYSYISDTSVMATVITHATKYSFEIEYKGTKIPSKDVHMGMSLNQAISFFRRLRFVRKTTVKKQRVIEWNEIVEEEL